MLQQDDALDHTSSSIPVNQVPEDHPHSTPMDDGKTLLYSDIKHNFPFKTPDRLLDDLLFDPIYISHQDQLENHGILKLSPLKYSALRQDSDVCSLGTFIDQVALQTKYEYKSVTCPEHNSLQVFFGVLMDLSSPFKTADDIIDIPMFHLKITIKTRSLLEQSKRRVGVRHFHLIEWKDLHEFDKLDLQTYDENDPKLLESAIYIASDTNKLILIELFKSEFGGTSEGSLLFKTDQIRSRYLKTCERMKELNPDNVPNVTDCYNTIYKIFKVPLSRESPTDPVKTIDRQNVSLNSHMTPEWLVSKYQFTLNEIQQENPTEDNSGDNTSTIFEFEPPDLTNYVDDTKIRHLREVYIRRCLELAFRGKLSLRIASDETKGSKAGRALGALHTRISSEPLYQLFTDSSANRFYFDSNLGDEENSHVFNSNAHFVNLCASYYYTDRDMIVNYETLCELDPANTGSYFDALSYIANVKGAYQLIAYCGRQDIVGKEALENALRYLRIDETEVESVLQLQDSFLLAIYKQEQIGRDPSYLADLKNAVRVLAKYKRSDYMKFYVDHEPYRTVSQGYSTLEIDELVDYDIMETAYTIKVNDSPGLKVDCDRALYTIAIHTRSIAIFNFLVENCPEFLRYYGPDKYNYAAALQLLGVEENATDETILNVFQQRWADKLISDPEIFLNLRAALTKIGSRRNSLLIKNFLETGFIDPTYLPAGNWPIGLNNIGNTCYLNSLLQYYFSIAPLRNFILKYSGTKEELAKRLSSMEYRRRIGGREVSEDEVERSVQFTYQLRDLFNSMIHSTSKCITPSYELAYLAFSPSNVKVEFEEGEGEKEKDENTQWDNNALEGAETGFENNKNETINSATNEPDTDLIDLSGNSNNDHTDGAGAPQSMITSDEDIDMVSMEHRDVTSKVAKISSGQLENALEMGRQQDVTECIGNVLYQLESACEPKSLDAGKEQNDLVKELFYGTTRQEILPLNDTQKIRTKYEGFSTLLVNISDHPRDIYDALDSYFMDEFLNLDEYGDVKRTISITRLPTILQIQIQRVYYDRERFMPFKMIDPLPFSDTIYMDRYANSDNPQIRSKKAETSELKERLKELEETQRSLLERNEYGLNRKDAFIEMRKLLDSGLLQSNDICKPETSNLSSALNDLVSEIDERLSRLYTEIDNLRTKIDHQFDKFKEVGYTLFAVFIHRGEASYGHYWVYIKDTRNQNIWRKYNDETVTEVPREEVFNFTEGNTATPYFLAFVKNEHLDDVEPLKRVIVDSLMTTQS